MILKDLGELSVVICDYRFKDGKELASVSKSRVKAPTPPIRCMNIKRKDLENGYFVDN
jgi:hypothetical protein